MMSGLELIAVATSLAAIVLTARRSMLCWPMNLVACALYFKLFLNVRLYADMLLQAAFGAAILYGWTRWMRDQHLSGTVMVRLSDPRQWISGIVAGGIGGAVIGLVFSRYTDAALPWVDATLSSFSLVAQYWTARRFAENWLLWAAIDVLYVGMFLYKGLFPTAALYAIFVVLALFGYQRWRAAQRVQRTSAVG